MARGSEIIGVGHCLPKRAVSSAEVAAGLGVDAGWIEARTGIRTRHVSGPGETVVSLAATAANDALKAANDALTTISVDAIIVATSTGERMPSTASQVAAALGVHAAAFDVNAACSGFGHALAIADGLIRADAAETALVIGADVISTRLDWTDHATAPLFGDGAGAVVVRACEEQRIGPVHWASVGEQGGLVTLRDVDRVIRQQGQPVFRWAIGLGAQLRTACELADVKPGDLAAFVPHQANLRIVNALADALEAPDAVVARDVIEVGNTMAASIPIALSRMAARGEMPTGPILLFGFGSGLAYAGQVVRNLVIT
jgi:3-oxoacyl-[acyl-carrier-protein] synthase-3